MQDPDTGWYSKKDSSPSRVAKKIKDAYLQLKQYDCAKAVILYNRDNLDVLDLYSAHTGSIPFKDEATGEVTFYPWWKKISKVEIKEIKTEIDLYIWIDKIDADSSEIFIQPLTDKGRWVFEKYIT